MGVRTPDFVVVGSGPNGLVAACMLARAGFDVHVLEAHPDRAGGAVGTEEATRPGFLHDVGAAFFPFGRVSPALGQLDLQAHGVRWLHAPIESAHPAPDGSVACIVRDPARADFDFGSPRDAAAWRRLATWYARIEATLLSALLAPVPAIGPLARLLPRHGLRLARCFATSGRSLSCRLFETAAARRVLPGLGLHVDTGPDDALGAGIGTLLGLVATTGGFPVPEGGAGAIAEALVRILEAHRGSLQLGARVERIVVRGGRAVAVRTAAGQEIEARAGVVADTAAPALFLELLEPAHVPGFVRSRMRRFVWGFGTFKIDWALGGAVPWAAEPARRAAVVHAGDDLDDLAHFTREVRAGRLPDRPYLLLVEQRFEVQ
jgi:phytoene dehydrogenase-like protein